MLYVDNIKAAQDLAFDLSVADAALEAARAITEPHVQAYVQVKCRMGGNRLPVICVTKAQVVQAAELARAVVVAKLNDLGVTVAPAVR